MRILFAAAEMAPLVRVGGLAEAAGGLVPALRRADVDVSVVLPDYGDVALSREKRRRLPTPVWAGKVWARSGVHAAAGPVTLVGTDDLRRSHPYVDDDGTAWPDNDVRFMQFSAGVAAIRDELRPSVAHLNDWHTAAAVALGAGEIPTVLTIHTLAYQGVARPEWMRHLKQPGEFEWYGQTNPMLGAIKLADRIIAVSPNYAREILEPDSGMGLHEVLQWRSEALVGILNGIDAAEWNPADDPHIAATFGSANLSPREENRRDFAAIAGWAATKEPIVGVVSRLVDQKGIDLLLAALPHFADLPARLFVLGSGIATFSEPLHAAAAADPERVYFHDGYDLALAHRIFAGADLFAMPSRFEPCGLAQMQAMRYGSIPVVTPVGGLVDTVRDADASRRGNGFVAHSVDVAGLVDALHRAVRAYRNSRRRSAIQKRGMEHDWSWEGPARRHVELYEELARSG